MEIEERRPEIEELLEEYREAKQAADAAKNHLADVVKRLTGALAAVKRKRYEVRKDGRYYRVTYVAAERTVINEQGLRKELGARQFAKITKVSVDRKKLENLIAAGEIAPEVVGKHIEVKKDTPSIRYTTGEVKEEE